MSNSEEDIRSLLDTFYRILSGRRDDARDWAKFRQLFIHDAHLTALGAHAQRHITVTDSVDSYIARMDPFLQEQDFYEHGSSYSIGVHGDMAQVCSRYEARISKNATEPRRKGVNLVQLVCVDGVWGIASMLWQDD
ncbi:MAG: nuclear transport factor 2 family protein [Phycisphaerales bacterium]|nr:MAG: nuclear transport factor 2 family protein [Phycisphaerales bacterium]